MLTSIKQVNEEFFRKFHGIKIPIKGVEKPILCRYARKSSHDYSEEQDNQVYPCIALQDFTPTLKPEWYIDMRNYFGGKSVDNLKGYLYKRPVWMEFRYDVSIATKSYNEYVDLQDYFLEKFVYGKRLMFNEKIIDGDSIGDVVPYTIRETDVPRRDGVFEKNYEFTLSAWVYPQKPEEVELIQQIVVGGRPVGLNVDNQYSLVEGLVDKDETFDVRIIPYDGGDIDGNNNYTLLGYSIVVGGLATLLKEDLGGFTVSLFKGDSLIERKITGSDGIIKMKVPCELSTYRIEIGKDEHLSRANFSLRELNSNLVFFWVFN